MKLPGSFIVIEGTDGSGKGTHTKLLVDWLRAAGNDVVEFDFPRYGEPSAYFVEQYLTGAYGTVTDTGPYRGSLFYALDRFAASFAMRSALAEGKILISNRYVGSNMGHQGAKFDTAKERAHYFAWNDDLEYRILGIPRPDLSIVLNMPSAVAQQFVDQKEERDYLPGRKRDIHEADIDHLARAEHTYLEMCAAFPDQFVKIDCAEGATIRSIDIIQNDIRALVQRQII